jgi:signal peptidase I
MNKSHTEIRHGSLDVMSSRKARLNTPACLLNDMWAELLSDKDALWATVVSGSMRPMIEKGDRVFVEKATSADIRFGDIIVFRKSDDLAVHRCIGRRNIEGRPHLLEKGDANQASTLVAPESLLGRVRCVSGRDRTVRVQTGRGRMAQIVLGCQSYAFLRLGRLFGRMALSSGVGDLNGSRRTFSSWVSGVARMAVLRVLRLK